MVMISYFREKSITLRECMELFFNDRENDSKDTASTYYSAINNMSNEIFKVDVSQLKKEQWESLTWNVLNKYKNKLKETCTNNTVNNRISAIKSIIKYLTARNAISYNIAELDLIETLNDDGESTEAIPLSVLMDYAKFFEEKESRKGKEKKYIALTALETGNRIQDLLSIKKNQFTQDGEDYILKSKGKNKGKGNKDYIKRIGAELYNELMALNPKSEKVFSVSYNTMLDAFNRANEYFGNTDPKYTPHSIRHLTAKLVYMETKDILAVKDFLNHDSIETTMRYLKIEKVNMMGLYTSMNRAKKDAYKEATADELSSVIKDLPLDVQIMINKKLEELTSK